MKKYISIVLIIIMALSITACGNNSNSGGAATGKEAGIWTLSDISLDVEEMKKSYEEENMEWHDLSEEEIKEYVNLYKLFMGGMYFQFNEDGTGLLNYYIPEEEKDDSMDIPPTDYKWENGKITYIVEEGEDPTTLEYSIENDTMTIAQSGAILTLNKVEKLEDIESTEFWKSLKELTASLEESSSAETDEG